MYHSRTEAEMEEAALRAELENELRNKKQCTYLPFECTQLSLDGYKFCSKHILQDKSAPYKQCSYIYSNNGKRCNLPAPRSDKKDYGYCSEHALKATLARNRQNSKHPLPQTAEVLLHSLSHYIKKPRIRSSSSSTQHSDDGDGPTSDIELKSSKYLDPFVDIDAAALYNAKCNQVLDVCSESESDIEASTFSSVWQDAQADSSDNESIDSDHEDVLKHANVFTAEEITSLTRDKLIRLQSLYIEQYRHLQYLLTKKRRKYLHSLKREKETCCNIYNQVRDNPKEHRLYKKLKALNNYQKCHGVDAILSKRLKDLRVKITDGSGNKSLNYSKCVFSEGGVKCGERSLPLAKHCQKHILEDINQVLFRACGKMTGDVECTTPIAAIFDESTCPLHLEIPPLRSYNQVRKDSESDAEETVEPPINYHQTPPQSQIAEPIKTEFMNYEIPPDIPKMESVPTMLFEENPKSMSESTCKKSNNPFIFGLGGTNLSEENEKLKLEARKAEECARNMMQLSTYITNQMEEQPVEIKCEEMEVETTQEIEIESKQDIEVVNEVANENMEVVEMDSSVVANTESETAVIELKSEDSPLPEAAETKPLPSASPTQMDVNIEDNSNINSMVPSISDHLKDECDSNVNSAVLSISEQFKDKDDSNVNSAVPSISEQLKDEEDSNVDSVVPSISEQLEQEDDSNVNLAVSSINEQLKDEEGSNASLVVPSISEQLKEEDSNVYSAVPSINEQLNNENDFNVNSTVLSINEQLNDEDDFNEHLAVPSISEQLKDADDSNMNLAVPSNVYSVVPSINQQLNNENDFNVNSTVLSINEQLNDEDDFNDHLAVPSISEQLKDEDDSNMNLAVPPVGKAFKDEPKIESEQTETVDNKKKEMVDNQEETVQNKMKEVVDITQADVLKTKEENVEVEMDIIASEDALENVVTV